MTLERVLLNEDMLVYNFSEKKRLYLRLLANRANDMLDLITTNQASQKERDEYHAIKFALKEIGAVDKAFLVRTKREKVKRGSDASG